MSPSSDPVEPVVAGFVPGFVSGFVRACTEHLANSGPMGTVWNSTDEPSVLPMLQTYISTPSQIFVD